MSDKRQSPRYQTLARARIEGAPEGETLLKNLGITGCCVECTVYPEMKPKTQYKLEIIPEAAAEIGSFELHVEFRWIRTGSYSSELGFTVIESPKGKRFFQRYVDYLSWRASSGGGSPAV